MHDDSHQWWQRHICAVEIRGMLPSTAAGPAPPPSSADAVCITGSGLDSSQLLDSGEFSDFTVIVEGQQGGEAARFACHRAYLFNAGFF